jgi:ribonuclease P protein component
MKPKISRSKGSKKKSAEHRDPKKEEYIRMLISVCEESGFAVRRERLKRGPTWSVQSGICQVKDEYVVFVDRALAQDDQLDFLAGALSELRIDLDQAQWESFPAPLQKVLAPFYQEEAAAAA